MEGVRSPMFPCFRAEICAVRPISALTQLLHCLDLIAAHTAAGLLLHQLAPLELLALHAVPEEEEGAALNCSAPSPMHPPTLFSLRDPNPMDLGMVTIPAGTNPDGDHPSSPPHSLFDGAGIRARGALLAGVPVGAGLGAVAFAADAGAVAAAHQPVAGHAGVRARGAVAVVSGPVRVAHAVPAFARPMAWGCPGGHQDPWVPPWMPTDLLWGSPTWDVCTPRATALSLRGTARWSSHPGHLCPPVLGVGSCCPQQTPSFTSLPSVPPVLLLSHANKEKIAKFQAELAWLWQQLEMLNQLHLSCPSFGSCL